MIVMQAHLPITSSLIVRLPGIPPHYLTWSTLIVAFYAIFYVKIDLVGALSYAPIWYIMYLTAVRWTAQDQKLAASRSKPSWTGTGKVLQWGVVVHALSWYVQIHPGHKVIEGAQPAIMQSLGGALFSAPLFALYEGIWFLGFRQEFHRHVLALVNQYTRELCANGATMRACESLR
jgi:uncharacterized membrane protein YGL010W